MDPNQGDWISHNSELEWISHTIHLFEKFEINSEILKFNYFVMIYKILWLMSKIKFQNLKFKKYYFNKISKNKI